MMILSTAFAWIAPLIFKIPYAGPIIKFFTSRVGKSVAFTLLVVGAFLFGFWRGDAHGDAQAARRAAEARLAAKEIDLASLNARYKSAQGAIIALEQHRIESEKSIALLQKELSEAKLQSTKAGAKHEPSALLDDRCFYTPLGRKRVRE